MYRMQVMGRNTTAMHWQRHKTGARHLEAAKRRGERLEVAVALGGDPALTYAATAPIPPIPGLNEYSLTGFLRGQRVELVKGVTVDLEVPAQAEIVLEGYVDPEAPWVVEGPFGDHTGFYTLPDMYPTFPSPPSPCATGPSTRPRSWGGLRWRTPTSSRPASASSWCRRS
jgi:4-hydroxy-3-polyprenylbenzoate decarboxylase